MKQVILATKHKSKRFSTLFCLPSFRVCDTQLGITNPYAVHTPHRKLSSAQSQRLKSSSTEFTSFPQEKIRSWLNFRALTEMLLFHVIVLHNLSSAPKCLARGSLRPGTRDRAPHGRSDPPDTSAGAGSDRFVRVLTRPERWHSRSARGPRQQGTPEGTGRWSRKQLGSKSVSSWHSFVHADSYLKPKTRTGRNVLPVYLQTFWKGSYEYP